MKLGAKTESSQRNYVSAARSMGAQKQLTVPKIARGMISMESFLRLSVSREEIEATAVTKSLTEDLARTHLYRG